MIEQEIKDGVVEAQESEVVVKQEDLGYKVTKVGFQRNRKLHNVVPDGSDQAVYDRPCTSISMVPSEKFDIMVGEQKRLSLKVEPSISNRPNVVWISSDGDKVVVSQNGLIRGIKKVDEVTITASTADSGRETEVSASVKVRVLDGTEEKSTLTVSIDSASEGRGTVSPAGEVKVVKGDKVMVTATPAEGFAFDKWAGASTASTNPVEITVDADKILKAKFKTTTPPTTFTISAEVITPGTGTAHVIVDGEDKGASASGLTSANTVKVQAVAAEGFKFSKWYKNAETESISNEATFEISELGNDTYKAEFVAL